MAAQGKPIYEAYCSRCHGKDGTDFTGEYVGQVTPVEKVKTDRHRLDSYTPELCANQNLLYAGYGDERFSHFRKTWGYANQPLDGLWLRAPYLHNGSVPTLRDLLEYSTNRPPEFYRGYDVYEPKRVGFVWNIAEEKGRRFFHYDTRLPGNGNYGHEGREYGTDLTAEEKDAVVECLKTF
jgi:cytochrome c peroxidase